jgi:cytochrome c oxidase assembly protein subunit 11
MTTDLSNRAVLKKLLFLTVGMFGFAYALVPMYNSACEAGLFIQERVTPSVLNTQVDSTRWITVEFVANVNEKMPWKFEPQQKSVKIQPGALTNVSYEVVGSLSARQHQVMDRHWPASISKRCNVFASPSKR